MMTKVNVPVATFLHPVKIAGRIVHPTNPIPAVHRWEQPYRTGLSAPEFATPFMGPANVSMPAIKAPQKADVPAERPESAEADEE